MDGLGGYSTWRWIFIIEGIATCMISLGLYFFIADWPRLPRSGAQPRKSASPFVCVRKTGEVRMDRLDSNSIKRVTCDWKIWISVVVYFGVSASTYTTLFIPTILVRMDYKAVDAQAHSIPIFVVSSALALGGAYFSDKLRHRFAFCLIGVVFSSLAYIILLLQTHVSIGVQYFPLFFLNGGCFMVLLVLWAWLSNIMGGHHKRAVLAGAQIGFGSAGGIVPSLLFVSANAPLYKTGFTVCSTLMEVAGLGMIIFQVGLMMGNRKREKGAKDYRHQLPVDEMSDLGDDYPSFRFTY